MKKLFFSLLALSISYDSIGQNLYELAKLVTVASVNEADIFLSKFNFKYDASKSLDNSNVVYFTKNDYTNKSTLTVGLYKQNSKKSYSIQITTYSDLIFNSYKNELEGYRETEFKKEEVKDGEYQRIYIKSDYLYVFSIGPSKDHPGKNLCVISISNLVDFR